LGALLTPALPFVVPSSEASLARIWGLGARRVKKFTVPASVRPPISMRVNKPENDDPSIIEPIELATDAA